MQPLAAALPALAALAVLLVAAAIVAVARVTLLGGAGGGRWRPPDGADGSGLAAPGTASVVRLETFRRARRR